LLNCFGVNLLIFNQPTFNTLYFELGLGTQSEISISSENFGVVAAAPVQKDSSKNFSESEVSVEDGISKARSDSYFA